MCACVLVSKFQANPSISEVKVKRGNPLISAASHTAIAVELMLSSLANPMVQEINACGKGLSDADAKRIAAALHTNSTIQVVNFSENQLSNACVLFFREMLKANVFVKRLNLNLTMISPAFKKEFNLLLINRLVRNDADADTVVTLDFSNQDLDDADVVQICSQRMADNFKVRIVVSPRGVSYGKGTHLMEIRSIFTHNILVLNHFCFICSQNLKNLKTIDFSSNNISDASVTTFIELLNTNPFVLTTINVDKNASVSPEAKALLKKAAASAVARQA